VTTQLTNTQLFDQTNPIDSKAYGKNVTRFVTPIVVGYLISFLTKQGLKLNPTTAYGIVAPIISSIWYSVISLLEHYFPILGRLLGAKKPIK
jgi:hypothetical protein